MKQTGVALVMVLWILALMTIMAGSFALSTQREAGLVSNARDRSEGQALAEGGIHYAMMMLSLPEVTRRWRSDGTAYIWETPAGKVRIRIFDESGKIDLNGAQETTLKTVLNSVIHNESQAEQLAHTILDWRDGDDLKRLHGAEADDYRAAGLETPPRNRNFFVIEELRGVLGITPALYRQIEPLFTLYTGQDGINPAKAPREILLTLTGGNEAQVDEFLALRSMSNMGAPPLQPIPGVQFHSTGDAVYTVRAEAQLPGRNPVGVDAAVKRGRGSDGSPFAFLHWKPHIAGSETGS